MTAIDAVGARLLAQLDFLREIDKLKTVLRRSLIMDGSRRENSAEHSWHIALAAMTLAEASNQPVDVNHVIKILLVHDIVEIDAGDTFAYDVQGRVDQASRETAAADRLFGLLPADQAQTYRALWDEFEARETAEARFAHAVDRVLPMLQNFATEGGSWRLNGVHRGLVAKRAEPIDETMPELGRHINALLDEAVARGYLAPAA